MLEIIGDGQATERETTLVQLSDNQIDPDTNMPYALRACIARRKALLALPSGPVLALPTSRRWVTS